MSTKSGPYDVPVPDGGEWNYQHDMMGDNFDGDVFYVWGPGIYLELPVLEGVNFADRAFLVGIPDEVLVWLDRWPKTPETNP